MLVTVCPSCQITYGDADAKFCGNCGSGLGEPGARGAVAAEERRSSAAREAEPVDAWIGRIVDGRYRVVERLGQGGMGLVYRVEHVRMGKVAAMKVLHRELAGDKEAAKRFRREAQAVSALSHPNIVQTFDFGQWDEAPYLVMEYVKGEDLGTIVRRDGPLPFARASSLFAQIGSALAEAHEAGIIHRDLKPENIVRVQRRDGSEHAKVLDFGLAKLREREDLAEITSRGNLVGTPYYMSPEQVRSEPLDARSDIYSLGATLYRVLTGEPPFHAATPVGVLTKHVTEELVLPSRRRPDLGIPPEADAIVTRAMAKAREDRFASAAEVKQAFERAGSREGSAASGSGRGDVVAAGVAAAPEAANGETTGLDVLARMRREDFDAFERTLRRRKLMAGLVVPALLLGLAGGGWMYARSRAPRAASFEREPNNSAGQANLIPTEGGVSGMMGKRSESGAPDMDYFLVPSGKGQREVSVEVTGLPNMDLVIELFDAQGRPVAKANTAGVAEGESLATTAIGPGEHFILIRQVWIDGTPPVENVSDRYTLAAKWGPAAAK